MERAIKHKVAHGYQSVNTFQQRLHQRLNLFQGIAEFHLRLVSVPTSLGTPAVALKAQVFVEYHGGGRFPADLDYKCPRARSIIIG